MVKTSHPQVEQLSAFVLGKLEPGDVDAVESHLSACETCCATVRQIHEDTFVGLVRRSGSVPEEPVDASEAATVAPEPTQEPPVAPAVTEPAAAGGADRAPQLPAELVNHARYRILEVLGSGGMGAVYKAEHRLMQRPVALKVINPEWVASKSAVERFRREWQAAGRLHHPNIVTAYDAEQAGETHFLVMEYVKGTDLGKLVTEGGPLPVAQACDYVRQAALGLQHARDNGMVHRDIKPHNLVVTSSGQVKILDFGLASLTSEAVSGSSGASSIKPALPGTGLTQVGSLMGTPDFMAPEQARDAHAADIRADIYSLGCTLYCLLTGKVPFPEGTPIDKIISHSERRPVPLSDLCRDLPAGLIEVVDKMMAKNPAERYQTPAEVAQALTPFAETAVLSLRRPAIEGKPGRRGPRRRLLVGTLIAAAVLLLGGVFYIVTDNGRLVIDSKVDDVQVVVSKGGKQYEVIDLKSGTAVKRLPTGDYQIRLKGDHTDVKLNRGGFTITRWGQVVVKVTRESTDQHAGPQLIRSFTVGKQQTITQDGIEIHDKAWRITAAKARTVRLFEVDNPGVEDCVVTYRAKLKTKNVDGKAYLEMWCRFPGMGEFFSKGLHNAISGTNDWASYEIPFFLKKGQRPDLLKLNLAIEGKGTVWIKDIEVLRSLPAKATDDEVLTKDRQSEIDAAVKAAQAWLKLVDEGKYSQSWEQSAELNRKAISKDELVKVYEKLFGELGKAKSRTIVSRQYFAALPGAPKGEYVVIQFKTAFENLNPATEQVVPMLDKDGQWRVSGYHVKAKSPEPEAKDVGTEAGWVQLFNGRDLTGWRKQGGTPATWKVDNGILRAAGSTGYLVSDGSYRNFRLRGEVRINPGASWRLLFRNAPGGLDPKKQAQGGLAADLVYKGKTGDVEGHMRMAVALTRDGKPLATHIGNVKPNDWFPIDLTVHGDQVDLKVLGGGVGASELKPSPAPGPITLQLLDANSVLEVRKLEIKELPPPATTTNAKLIHSFADLKEHQIITRNGVAIEDQAWRITADKSRIVRLFEVEKPGVEDCVVVYHAKFKTKDVEGKAYLEMWCRMPGLGEFFSKGFAVTGTKDWASYEIPFFLKKGQRPDLLKLNLAIEGRGTVWIKDIEVLKVPPR
jgi:serine/threonine protein kinase